MKFKYFTKPDFTVNEIEPKIDKKSGLLYRPHTTDKGMINECYNHYKNIELRPNDVVLDLGANVGGFIKMSSDAGVRGIVGIEADQFNFEILHENFKDIKNIKLAHRCVVGNPDSPDEITFLIKDNNNSACAGKIAETENDLKSNKFHHQTVKTIQFKNLLKKFKPTILKIDIEGAEYDIFREKIPDYVRIIAIELHGMNKSSFVKLLKLKKALDMQFDLVECNPTILFNRDNVLLNNIYIRKDSISNNDDEINDWMLGIRDVPDGIKKIKSADLITNNDGTSITKWEELNEKLSGCDCSINLTSKKEKKEKKKENEVKSIKGKITKKDILSADKDKIFGMMDPDVVTKLGNFIKEFNKREWSVRIAKKCTFNEYYEKGYYNHKEEFGYGFVIDGNAVPYFHPNRSFHDEIIWLNNNLFYDTEVSWENKLLNSAIVKFYGPSNTLDIITRNTPWKYLNFAELDRNKEYKWQVFSNIDIAKENGELIWGTTELRTSLQTASRNYTRDNPSIIDKNGSICGRIKPISDEELKNRKMRSSDMIQWIHYLSNSWIPFYKSKPTMEESFKELTKLRGIGNYYGYHFSSNLARMPGIGAKLLIDTEFKEEFKALNIEHGNLDENDNFVIACPGSSKTLKRLIPGVPLTHETANKLLITIRDNQLEFFDIERDSIEHKYLIESSEIGSFTTFGTEISCCQFNVFNGCKNSKKIAAKRAKAPISIEVWQ